jgi:hypothetical protein
MSRPERGPRSGPRCCTRPAGESPATVGTPGAPCSRLRASGEIRPSKRSVESRKRGIGLVEREQSCGPNVSEPLQPREIGTRKVGWPSRSFRGEGNRLRAMMTGDPQDTPGVRVGARSEGLVRNRRDPSRRPASGEGGGYKPTAKCHRAGRESEGLVVPWMAPTTTALEGRGSALVVSEEEGKGEGMPARASNPTFEARQPRGRLFMVAKRQPTALGAGLPTPGLAGLTSLSGPCRERGRERARDMRRPSVSRVLEIGMHGLKGGFRSSGPQGHRA